jgi:hypothetical protein
VNPLLDTIEAFERNLRRPSWLTRLRDRLDRE